MKICYVGNPQSVHLQRWMTYFVDRGDEVHVITPQPAHIDGVHLHEISMPAVWNIPTTFLHRIRVLGYLLHRTRSWLLVRHMRRMVEAIAPDVLDGHYLTYYGVLASMLHVHPLVLTVLGSDVLIDPEKHGVQRAAQMGKALGGADAVVCPSRQTREAAIRLGARPEIARVIPLGADIERFRPRQRETQATKGPTEGDPTIVVSTRKLEPVYNVETLIRAIPLVQAEVSGASFVICGDGSQREYLESLAQGLGVSPSVRFVGWIAHGELHKCLASADIYVSTSLSDGAPVSLLEAMACGLPVVSTDAGSAGELIRDGENGFLFRARDFRTLASRLAHLIRDEDERQRLGRANPQVARERGDFRKTMAEVDGVYREVIDKHGALQTCPR